ncbi:MAG TPA: hypothetical protein VFX70_09620 [Mycobacteriales bacterium]|nr:hypothetical protein [Mycobacteriales bacterium]
MNRHPIDVVSLVFGLMFLGVAALWGTPTPSVINGSGWRLPVLLIAAGTAGLLVSLRGRRGDRGR